MSELEELFPEVVAEFPYGEGFSGISKAIQWCEDNGYSVGPMQRGAPIGIALGKEHYIAKWRNIDERDINRLSGAIVQGFIIEVRVKGSSK